MSDTIVEDINGSFVGSPRAYDHDHVTSETPSAKIERMTVSASNLNRQTAVTRLASYLVRIALAAAFLSAVADRFGIWGPPGTEGVVWGDLKNYESYVALLNWFAPQAVVPVLGWFATIAEVAIAIGLLIGWQLRWFALGAGLLLTAFGAAMCGAIGVKPPLDYSVFSAASAAYLLFAFTTRSPAVQLPT